jgi:hypothetical protein
MAALTLLVVTSLKLIRQARPSFPEWLLPLIATLEQ